MSSGHDTPESVSELRARILGAVQAEPAPTRARVRRRTALFLIVAFGISLVVFWLVGGVRAAPRPYWLVATTGLGSGALAFAVAWLAFGRGLSPLGRPRALLAGLALASPALLLLWKLATSAQVPDMMERWPERIGLRCLGIALATGLCPLAVFVVARRGSDPVHPVALGAALGAAAGTFAASLVDLWCPVAYLPHLLLGHVLPLVLLTLAGALLGARLLAPR